MKGLVFVIKWLSKKKDILDSKVPGKTLEIRNKRYLRRDEHLSRVCSWVNDKVSFCVTGLRS